MSGRASGFWLIAAATLFWLSWSLMPGVGITDAQTILDLVSRQRSLVALSVVVQLLSAACYAPALIGLVALPDVGVDRQLRRAAVVLLVGAMGSAADAIFHLLAHAMTSPGLDSSSFVALMEIMQGPGLRFLLPLIAAFFIGSVWLSVALAKLRIVSRWNPALHALAVVIGIVGGLLASQLGIEARIVGLSVLGVIAAAQIWSGAALAQIPTGAE